MTETLCLACRTWFDRAVRTCPECGTDRPAFNAGLVSQRWESALNAQAARASKEA